jgi:hypothetical protein
MSYLFPRHATPRHATAPFPLSPIAFSRFLNIYILVRPRSSLHVFLTQPKLFTHHTHHNTHGTTTMAHVGGGQIVRCSCCRRCCRAVPQWTTVVRPQVWNSLTYIQGHTCTYIYIHTTTAHVWLFRSVGSAAVMLRRTDGKGVDEAYIYDMLILQ